MRRSLVATRADVVATRRVHSTESDRLSIENRSGCKRSESRRDDMLIPEAFDMNRLTTSSEFIRASTLARANSAASASFCGICGFGMRGGSCPAAGAAGGAASGLCEGSLCTGACMPIAARPTASSAPARSPGEDPRRPWAMLPPLLGWHEGIATVVAVALLWVPRDMVDPVDPGMCAMASSVRPGRRTGAETRPIEASGNATSLASSRGSMSGTAMFAKSAVPPSAGGKTMLASRESPGLDGCRSTGGSARWRRAWRCAPSTASEECAQPMMTKYTRIAQ
mmetsp:Transcript_13773/g.42867  ORF Transcript_13773/g.42867 Transcript_13773/m.42867 type:complete len:281 (+) Transcript_13773:1510-2352(+)